MSSTTSLHVEGLPIKFWVESTGDADRIAVAIPIVSPSKHAAVTVLAERLIEELSLRGSGMYPPLSQYKPYVEHEIWLLMRQNIKLDLPIVQILLITIVMLFHAAATNQKVHFSWTPCLWVQGGRACQRILPAAADAPACLFLLSATKTHKDFAKQLADQHSQIPWASMLEVVCRRAIAPIPGRRAISDYRAERRGRGICDSGGSIRPRQATRDSVWRWRHGQSRTPNIRKDDAGFLAVFSQWMPAMCLRRR